MGNKIQATEEQLAYAKLLDMGMKAGLVMIIITFALYVTGFMHAYVPRNDLSKYWGMKVGDYLYVMSQVEKGKADEAVNLIKECKKASSEGKKPEECKAIAEEGHKMAGWSWLKMLSKGDYVNFLGIAFLAGITIICYLPIIPIFLRKKDTVFAVICILEVLVLTLAASGILKGGGH